MNDEMKSKAYQAGWDAFWENGSPADNPFTDSELSDEWMGGFLTAQSAALAGL